MDMGYPQPPTTVQTDNSMEYVFENKILKQLISKQIDMCFYCIQYKVKLQKITVYCRENIKY